MITTTTLRPGLLVSLKTSLAGNVSYRTQIIDENHLTDDGAAKARWETERTVADPVELEAGKVARTKVRTLICKVCSASAFGLLCPEDKAPDLEVAMIEARKVADEFNSTARLSRIGVYVITGRIAADDVEATKAIKSEVRDLFTEMQRGIKNLDVKAIRDAADKAKSLGQMLSADSKERVEIAIEAARKAAKEIRKAGEAAEIAVDEAIILRIQQQRSAFLDMDDAAPVAQPSTPAQIALDMEAVASLSVGDQGRGAPVDMED